MPIHNCNKCGQSFTRKVNYDYHVQNNACKVISHNCKFCDKGFTTETSMYRHMRKTCKVKKEGDEEKEKIYGKLVKIQEDSNKKILKIEEENNNLKKQVAEMKKQIAQLNDGTGSTSVKMIKDSNVSINNGTVNNTNNTNIMLVGYGNEDITKLSQGDILKVLQNGYYSTIKLTEAVHFNPKHPEYHNIYISNMKDKYAMMFDGNNWTLTMKEDLINRIYEDKKNYIESNLEVFIDSLTESRRKALERWLNTDDNDEKISDIKNSIKLLLYNSRRMPLSIIDMNDEKKQIGAQMNTTKKGNKKISKEVVEVNIDEPSEAICDDKKSVVRTKTEKQIHVKAKTQLVDKNKNSVKKVVKSKK